MTGYFSLTHFHTQQSPIDLTTICLRDLGTALAIANDRAACHAKWWQCSESKKDGVEAVDHNES